MHMFDGFAQLHFLRPWVLLLFIPLACLFVYWLWTKKAPQTLDRLIAPHLREALMMSHQVNSLKPRPLLLFCLLYSTTVIAAAGPSWRLQPSPFLQDQAVVVAVLKVEDSMTAEDIPPTRLQRGVQKLEDLLALRKGAPHALVAYAGSAHLVMPITRDANAILFFARALSPELMPTAGENQQQAWQLATTLLANAGKSGAVVWLSDSALTVTSSSESNNDTTPIFWLPITQAQVAEQSQGVRVRQIELSVDDEDVRQIAARVENHWLTPESDEGEQWSDEGYWLVPLIALLSLFWFRPGWIIRYGH